jgi:ribosomal protein S18 acetylase RimI-like enzyme
MKINQDIFVQQGILDCQIDQLIEYSHTDSDIQKFTSDKARFADKKSFHQWQQQGRIIYTLTDTQKNLLGIIWFGQKDPPIDIKTNFTFAIRIYSSARGQGLSQEFMKIAFKDLLKNQPKSHIIGFWLETSNDNFPAIHSYQKFGFKTVSSPDYNNKIIMTLDSANINYEIKIQN